MNYLRHILLLTLLAFYQNKSTVDNENINVIVSLHSRYAQAEKRQRHSKMTMKLTVID